MELTNISEIQNTYKSYVEEEIPGGRIRISEEVPQLDKGQLGEGVKREAGRDGGRRLTSWV